MTNAIAQEMHGVGRDSSTEFAPYRRRYVARQQAMETSIGPLRARMRETLAARSPEMAKLAAVDAVMEQVLEAQLYRLLATVPVLLEQHFKRSRAADAKVDADADTSTTGDDNQARRPAWLDAFGHDMQGVLIAELDLRLQPVEGLLEALRASHRQLKTLPQSS